MNLNHLAIFHAVADEGSMSRGAERLFISQPAVSKQIKELEAALGIMLFDRLSRGIRLTVAGEMLAGYARRLFAVEAEAERTIGEMKGLVQGQLTLGASLTIGDYLLPQILGAYRKKFPGIELHLEIANTHVIQQKLLENALDVGLTEGFVEDKELDAEVFGEDALIAVVPPGHALLEEDEVSAERFCAEPFLMREPGSGTREVIERALALKGIVVQPAMSLGSTEAIKRGVAAGLGVAIISRLALSMEIEMGLLHPLMLSDLSITRPLHLVRLRGKSEGAAVQAFLRLLKVSEPLPSR
ncbi:MAG: LysR family transcriptional regulator [Janthinobacterium lividum]